MYINFRQGIVTYPVSGNQQAFLQYSGGYVSLLATAGKTDVAFAHGSDDYLLTESSSVTNAWGPLPVNTDCWLYWDIDRRTAVRTFGYTTSQPVYGTTQPAVIEGLHWFNTSTGVMYACISGAFREVIRVFATKINNSTFIPMGYGFSPKVFAGTQVGLSTSSVYAGRILMDNLGNPIRRASGHFITTEHDLFINGSNTNIIRIESTVFTGTAESENLHAYQVVTFSDFGVVRHATYDDLQEGVIAIMLEDLNRYDTGIVCLQGQVTNPTWNWSRVGAQLWVDNTGTLSEINLHVTDPLTYPTNKLPVARVVTQTSITFAPPLT